MGVVSNNIVVGISGKPGELDIKLSEKIKQSH